LFAQTAWVASSDPLRICHDMAINSVHPSRPPRDDGCIARPRMADRTRFEGGVCCAPTLAGWSRRRRTWTPRQAKDGDPKAGSAAPTIGHPRSWSINLSSL